MRLHRIGLLILSACLVLPSASALRGLTQGDTIYATSFSNGCEKILKNDCLVHCAQEYKLTMMGSDCNGIKFESQKTASDVAGCTSCPVLELDSTLTTSTCDSEGMGPTDIMFDGDQHRPIDKSLFYLGDSAGSYVLKFEPPDKSTCICSMVFSETKPSSAAVIPTTHCNAPPPPPPAGCDVSPAPATCGCSANLAMHPRPQPTAPWAPAPAPSRAARRASPRATPATPSPASPRAAPAP